MKNKFTIENLKLVESKNLFESINWQVIHNLFYENNWQYGLDDLRIPRVEELKNIVLSLMIDLENRIFKEGLPKKEDLYEVGSGRFIVSIDDIGLMQINLDIGNIYIGD